MSAKIMYEIAAKQITPPKFSCDEILEGSDGEQYRIIHCIFIEDHQAYSAVIQQLEDDERVEPDFLSGTIQF